MSSYRHVIMSSCHQTTISSYHHIIRSSCHHTIMWSCHDTIWFMSSRHHTIVSSCHQHFRKHDFRYPPASPHPPRRRLCAHSSQIAFVQILKIIIATLPLKLNCIGDDISSGCLQEILMMNTHYIKRITKRDPQFQKNLFLKRSKCSRSICGAQETYLGIPKK